MPKTPKTVNIIACRKCGGEYFANDTRITLHPGDEHELPDEITIIVRKVARCSGCKVIEDRTRGGMNKRMRYER